MSASPKTVPSYELEKARYEEGFQRICGIDEAGRGPLAGPVFAAAVVLKPGTEIPGLNDSKKLTEKKREALFAIITEQAVAYSIARVEAEDLRGGGALAVAALGAEGTTILSGLHHIDRGYEQLEQVLSRLGAGIERRDT